MAKAKKDSYKKLIRIAVVLAVLAVVFGAGHIWLSNLYANERSQAEAARDERNAELTRQYQQAMAEYQAALRSSETTEAWPTPTGVGLEVIDVSAFPLTSTRTYTFTRSQILSGGMLLLNHWHSIPGDFPESDVVSVLYQDKSIPVSGSSVKLFPNAIEAISEMLKAAADEGLENFLIQSAYRTMAEQTSKYQAREAKYTDKFSGDALREKVVASGVNYPGTSEYQSGLSFEIQRWKKNDAEFNGPKFSTTEHSDWLVANSWRYGIVFRFPVTNYPNATVTDKSFKTGESSSLSIYRYVGKGNAAVMHAMDFCMEEYIEYLIAHPHLALYEDGTLRYEIMRVRGGDTASDVTVQASANCQSVSASTDNMGGIIIVMSY